ncbi:2-C-methyl-D-erythritol 2,4-cyclodiphosphate synthase [Siminovitchia sp. 179-K 8D1 HS]|uniref:2-C-methyl-D-erythritol 2,4-cyclodiphosphate synthase n=1 Tax=Siminovitchia sp. 179-K 8D1 HS TaxID=3142385 RepID=UPI0039A1CE12
MLRIGQGFDVHQFADNRPLIIGGIEIPYEKGLIGHSDADVLLHTIADAALGAIGEGDIGRHFPDTDIANKDLDSARLLEDVWELVKQKGYGLVNVDCTIMAQKPKMAPYIEQMRERIAGLLEAERARVNVKATTTEKLGFVGREEGIAAMAVILLQKNNESLPSFNEG